ncbi:hypothetical protein JI721_02570 [Alicyclobacillus cycloheptanicus]|jgi:hypothetical protein|uniref:Mannosyltransferase (PIG-V) n=1 Tax=Alicyclobacillus cycloheptanicus TaxID=1457 RepID=A0ABT9XF22_9BACL|nr:mannosyltransferase family protein [Alicyclobacillus cycloheptanicus]MDQ0188892.1 hypothetical protein [Alicyclobacillus cycloheptanicus]WDM01753.1 hypothetical protein JI721_02570 [Alicyclobacillus cycloheptanicus]
MNFPVEAAVYEPPKSTAPKTNPRAAVQRIGQLTVGLAAMQQLLMLCVGIVIDHFQHHRILWRGLFIQNLSQWDSGWLLQIAQHGYTDIAHTAFFPLYPALIWLLHLATGIGDTVCGLLLSLASFLVALFVFGLWANQQFGWRTAWLGMTLLALFPTAFFFRAVYTESLFLALSVLGVYASSRGRFGTAGLCVGLAALTRNTGIFLTVILLFDYVADRGIGWRWWTRAWWAGLNLRALRLAVPVVCLAAYLVWLKVHTGYYLAFTHAEKLWNRTYMAPWETLWRALVQLTHPHGGALLPYHALEFLCWLLLLLGFLAGLRFARSSAHQRGTLIYFLAFLCIVTATPAGTGPGQQNWDYLLSVPRFDLAMYPMFAYLAHRLRSRTACVCAVAVSVLAFCVVYGSFCAGSFIA